MEATVRPTPDLVSCYPYLVDRSASWWRRAGGRIGRVRHASIGRAGNEQEEQAAAPHSTDLAPTGGPLECSAALQRPRDRGGFNPDYSYVLQDLKRMRCWRAV
jgi:hypothetical protein